MPSSDATTLCEMTPEDANFAASCLIDFSETLKRKVARDSHMAHDIQVLTTRRAQRAYRLALDLEVA